LCRRTPLQLFAENATLGIDIVDKNLRRLRPVVVVPGNRTGLRNSKTDDNIVCGFCCGRQAHGSSSRPDTHNRTQEYLSLHRASLLLIFDHGVVSAATG
jgi:hypothetical protein